MPQFKMIYKHPNKLVPYDRNAKVHTKEQIDKLSASMTEFDFDVPIVVDADLVIIKGHGRQAAALQAGIKKVPVIVRTDLTDIQVRAARLADNKLSESEWDLETLVEELEAIEDIASEIDFTGFDATELEELHNELNYDALETKGTVSKEIEFNQKCQIIINCKNENEQHTMYNRLTKEGYVCRVLNI